jgi:U3 small nucleolar RNA-associated protein 11
MSSLRNAVKRITHKERAQPRARARFGLLEKKQDYKKRALDYQKKRDYVQAMKLRAEMRNPDEFYMGMHNSQMKEGKHQKQANDPSTNAIDPDTIALMKNQDLAHVRHQRQKELKKIERLQSNLHLLNNQAGKNSRAHIVFVDDPQQAQRFDVAEHFQTLPEFVDRAFNRPRVVNEPDNGEPESKEDSDEKSSTDNDLNKKRSKTLKNDKVARRQLEKIAKARAASYAELEGRIKRQKAMRNAEAHLCVEKLVSGKGRKRKIKEAEDGKPAVYKWRRKRSK